MQPSPDDHLHPIDSEHPYPRILGHDPDKVIGEIESDAAESIRLSAQGLATVEAFAAAPLPAETEVIVGVHDRPGCTGTFLTGEGLRIGAEVVIEPSGDPHVWSKVRLAQPGETAHGTIIECPKTFEQARAERTAAYKARKAREAAEAPQGAQELTVGIARVIGDRAATAVLGLIKDAPYSTRTRAIEAFNEAVDAALRWE